MLQSSAEGHGGVLRSQLGNKTIINATLRRQRAAVTTGAATHHRSAATPNDSRARFELMAVHDAGARERERSQVHDEENDGVDEQHRPLDI